MADNIYYHPEKHDLTIVATAEDPEAFYSFDLAVLWKDGEGRFFYDTDSGCSCPSPFEDIRSLDDLTEIISWHQLQDELAEWMDWGHYSKPQKDAIQAERHHVLMEARKAGLE